MNPVELKSRTKAFAVRIIKLADKLPDSRSANAIARQIVRSGMSVGANYRAACRAKSRADFISKLGIVEEECDETLYWMELLVESGKMKMHAVTDLMNEATQILAIVVASINTARSKSNPQSAIRNPQSR
jgi:four helix bundle protein